jgi:hypothetical protein
MSHDGYNKSFSFFGVLYRDHQWLLLEFSTIFDLLVSFQNKDSKLLKS